MEEERNLLDYAYVLVKWRRLIFSSVLTVSLVTAGVTMLLPEKWTAGTTLLPPEEEFDQFGLSMLISSAMPGNLGGLMGTATPTERLLTLLESKRVFGAIVDRFDLQQKYDSANRDLAIESLDEAVERELGRDGTLSIEVEASSPELAAEIANGLAAELDEINREVKRRQARYLRQFLETRALGVQQEIAESALALRDFQETYGLVDVEVQTAAAVEVIRNIVQELTLLEVKLGVSRRQLRPNHELQQLQEMEVEELRRQLQILSGELEVKKEEQVAATHRALGPPLKEMPELGMEYTRLALELKVKEQIITLLGAKLEEAKYKEALDTPTITVLDPATPPLIRSAPRRSLIVLMAAFTSLVVSVVLSFIFESVGRLGRENQEKIEAIRQLLRSRAKT